MIKKEIDELEKLVMKHLVARRNLGAASFEAGEILIIWETLLKIVGHLTEQASRKNVSNRGFTME